MAAPIVVMLDLVSVMVQHPDLPPVGVEVSDTGQVVLTAVDSGTSPLPWDTARSVAQAWALALELEPPFDGGEAVLSDGRTIRSVWATGHRDGIPYTVHVVGRVADAVPGGA